MPQREDLAPDIKNRLNGVEIEATWVEILEVLSEQGPASISDIEKEVDLESKAGVLQALYGLMSLDIREPEVEEQILVKDRIEGVYGLPWQVSENHTARGVVPMRPTERRVRLLDVMVQRLDRVLPDTLPNEFLNRLDDIGNRREFLGAVVNRDSHQTRTMQRRAQAFQFPFEQWAAAGRPKRDSAAVIEALEVLAGTTENVSRQLVTEAVTDVYSANDEQGLAEILTEWLSADDPYITEPAERALVSDSSEDSEVLLDNESTTNIAQSQSESSSDHSEQ